ncbi:MAG TPA: DUF3090 family protein [Aggregatilineales bacterium]|nr:DUF3090 family protein [Aggregatilineales bacterium]
MANAEIELDPVDFITVGTVGPKGRRLFHLQAGKGSQIVSLIIEKEQARRLGEALTELLDDLNRQHGDKLSPDMADRSALNMDLREPIEPEFRVGQMGLGYDDDRDMVILVAQELIALEEGQDLEQARPGIARFWGTRQQMRALSAYTNEVVRQGRADPKSNGRLLYYWT